MSLDVLRTALAFYILQGSSNDSRALAVQRFARPCQRDRRPASRQSTKILRTGVRRLLIQSLGTHAGCPTSDRHRCISLLLNVKQNCPWMSIRTAALRRRAEVWSKEDGQWRGIAVV